MYHLFIVQLYQKNESMTFWFMPCELVPSIGSGWSTQEVSLGEPSQLCTVVIDAELTFNNKNSSD